MKQESYKKVNELNNKNPLSYEHIVIKELKYFKKIPFIHRECGNKKIIIMIGTHNCKGVFPSLYTLYNDINLDFDLLFIAEEVNTYYHCDDNGAAYFDLMHKSIEGYTPENVVFFGASMAGYSALKWALKLNANAVVSNPQLDLQITAPLAWPELRQTIARAGKAEAITAHIAPNASSALVSLWSKHPMDVANLKIFLDLVLHQPNLSVSIDQNLESDHLYLISGYSHFLSLLHRALELRKFSIAQHAFPMK